MNIQRRNIPKEFEFEIKRELARKEAIRREHEKDDACCALVGAASACVAVGILITGNAYYYEEMDNIIFQLFVAGCFAIGIGCLIAAKLIDRA